MATATLNLRISPRRMLSLTEAAEYCGLARKLFAIQCPVAPVRVANNVEKYDMQDLDTWINTLKSDRPDDSDDTILARLD